MTRRALPIKPWSRDDRFKLTELIFTAVGIAVAAGIAILVTRGGDVASAPEASATSPSQITTPVQSPGATTIPETAFAEILFQSVRPCDELPEGAPLAEALKRSSTVVVDGRCDSNPEAPTGVYDQPDQSSVGLDTIPNGTVINDACITIGQSLQDQAGSTSAIWIRYTYSESGEGYVPAIWVQGEDGLEAC